MRSKLNEKHIETTTLKRALENTMDKKASSMILADKTDRDDLEKSIDVKNE